MNPCPQCGAAPQATDKFCNICGTPVGAGGPPPGFDGQPAQASGFGAPPQPGGFGAPPQPGGFGAPPPHGGGFGAPPPQGGQSAPPQNAYGAPPAPAGGPPRCQMGHEITPGASYCAHGHPMALDAVSAGNDHYGGGYGQGAPAGGYAPPAPAPGAFGQPAYGGAPAGFGAPDPNAPYGGAPAGFGGGAPDPHAPYGGAPAGYGGGPADPNAYGGGFGGPPPQHGGFGAPAPFAPPAPPGGYAGQQPGYPQQPGFPPGHEAAGAPAPAPAPVTNLPPTALRGFLVSYQSNAQGEFWPLSGGRATVGRAGSGEQVDISLGDATISSRHAAFVVDAMAGTVQIEDTGSTNGTFVNEEHIGFNGKRDLRDGDKIRFGGYTAIVKIVTHL